MNATGCYVQGDMFVRLRGDHSQHAVFADEQGFAGSMRSLIMSKISF
jgi:hypothetical protein